MYACDMSWKAFKGEMKSEENECSWLVLRRGVEAIMVGRPGFLRNRKREVCLLSLTSKCLQSEYCPEIYLIHYDMRPEAYTTLTFHQS